MQKYTYIGAGIGGVVLAGGLSTRMGKDKALLVDNDGRSLLEKNMGLLQECCEKVWVSCRTESPLRAYPCVFDVYEDLGPASAIYSSLMHAHNEGLDALLVLACDMPYIQSSLLEKLIHERNNAIQELKKAGVLGVTAYYEPEKNVFQGLCALWEVNTASCAHFAQCLNDVPVKNKLRLIYAESCQHRIMYNDKDYPHTFDNLNTPDDVQHYRASACPKK